MDGKQEKPPFAESYGGAKEIKMSAEQKDLQGPSQEEAQEIRDGVGLTPEEIGAINQPKSVQIFDPEAQTRGGDPLNNEKKDLTRTHLVKKTVNVAAALTTAVAGVGLAAVAGDALKNSPPAIVAGETDPSRDNPSAGSTPSTTLTTSTLRTSPPQGVVFGEVEPIRQAQDKQVEGVEKVDGPIRQALRPRAQGRVAQGGPFGDAQGGRADGPQPVTKLDAPVADGSAGSPQDAPVTEEPAPAPVEGPMNVVTTIHMPAMFKGAPRPGYQAQEVKEPEIPLYLREFGAPERGVVMRNKVEQGGGSLAYVQMGDQELWNNLLYLRETYGRPDLKLEISFYSTRFLWERNRSGGEVTVIPWDVWARNPGIYKNGVSEFVYREADKTLDFRIVLPETLPGKVPTEDSVNKMHFDFMHDVMKVFLSREDGKPAEAYQNFAAGREPEYSEFLRYPVHMFDGRPVLFRTARSALWVKLE